MPSAEHRRAERMTWHEPVVDMIALVSDLDAPIAALVESAGYQFPHALLGLPEQPTVVDLGPVRASSR